MNQYYKLMTTACLVVTFFAAKAQCDTVSNYTFNNVTSSKALVTWNLVGNAIDYEYAVRTDNNIPVQGTITTQTSIQIMGLPADVTIYVCVRARCNAGLSAWTCSNFKTLPGSTAINTVSQSETGVYPNPVTDVLHFNFADKGAHHITIVNSIGTVVSTHILQSGETSLNLSNLQGGLYFVKTASENNTQIFKIDKR